MAINNQVNIIVKASDQATKVLKNVWGWFWKLNSSLQKNADRFKKIWAIWGAAFAWIWLWIKALTDRASDLEETTQKFGVVFRDLSDEANKTAKDLSKWFWLSQKAAKWFLADLWDVTSWFWLSQKASLQYAKDVTALWVDLASFANIAWGSEEAIDRLNKWFLGEHENLKALWIIINDTMLKKQLLADWTSELTWLELEQAKIQARMTIAYSQSANAIWDFERSKWSLANQTRILQARFEDVTTELWQAFLPIITTITAALVPIIEKFAKWASENQQLVKIIWIVVLAIAWLAVVFWTLWLVLPSIIAWFTWLVTVFWVMKIATLWLWRALLFLSANPIWLIITAIAAIIAAWFLLITHWDEVKAFVVELWKTLIKVWENVKSALFWIWESLKEWASNAFSALGDFVMWKLNWILSFAMWIVNKIKSAFKSVASVFWGGWEATWGIDWARANWWPVSGWKTYLVGEKWPELFTPPSGWNIVPNNALWGNSLSVAINMGWVSVWNQADENRLADTIIERLTRELQLNKFWVA